MNVRNLNYANMVNEAQDILNEIWIPNVGDLVMAEDGMIGILTNRDKQQIGVGGTKDTYNVIMSYVGVSLVHNGKLWSSCNPIWMPRLDQLTELVPSTDPQNYLSNFNRWRFCEDANYIYKFIGMEELAFAFYMHMQHNKRWNFEEKKWEA